MIVDEQRVDKRGQLVEQGARIRIRTRKGRIFVSRGGQKLDHALEVSSTTIDGFVCLDLGASTGGFTDCLLTRGASRVYAVDVGYGLLDWRLRTNPAVINLERTHAAQLSHEEVPEPIQLVCADLSFTSLEKIIPTITWSLAEQSIGAFLIKPQFEAEKHEIQPGGLVLDPAVHARVCQRIEAFMGDVGFRSFQCIRSPITGTKGNIEFILMCLGSVLSGVETSSTEIN